MAFSSTRVKPTITTATDAGQALDEYLDAEVDQLYDNDNYLDDRIDTVEDNLVTPAGTIKYGTNAERLAYSNPLEATRWHETDTNTDWIYDSTTATWRQIVSFNEVDTDGTLAANSDSKVPSQKATKTYSDALATTVVGTTTRNAIKGLYKTSVVPASGTAVTIAKGEVEIDGKLCYISADITYTPSSLTASTPHFVMATKPSGDELTSSEISATTTAPTFDSDKRGYYDASGRRCIGVFLTNATPAIIMARLDEDDYYSLDTSVVFLSTTASATTATLVSTGVPALGRLTVDITARTHVQSTVTANWLWLWNGDSAETTTASNQAAGGFFFGTAGDVKYVLDNKRVKTNTSGQVSYYTYVSASLDMQLNGFFMPAGLRRTE